MTAHGHATPGAEASHDHHYEGTPADRLGPGEPSTPLWLPLVGIGLFLATLLAYVVTRPAGKTGAELAKEASPEAAVASAAPPAPAPPPGLRRMPGMPSGFVPNAQANAAPPPAGAPQPTANVVQKPFVRPVKPGPIAAPPAPPPRAPAPPPAR